MDCEKFQIEIKRIYYFRWRYIYMYIRIRIFIIIMHTITTHVLVDVHVDTPCSTCFRMSLVASATRGSREHSTPSRARFQDAIRSSAAGDA